MDLAALYDPLESYLARVSAPSRDPAVDLYQLPPPRFPVRTARAWTTGFPETRVLAGWTPADGDPDAYTYALDASVFHPWAFAVFRAHAGAVAWVAPRVVLGIALLHFHAKWQDAFLRVASNDVGDILDRLDDADVAAITATDRALGSTPALQMLHRALLPVPQ